MAHHFLQSNETMYSLYYAVVVEWQTRYLEGVVGVYPWRFESSLPHTNIKKKLRTLCGAFFFA